MNQNSNKRILCAIMVLRTKINKIQIHHSQFQFLFVFPNSWNMNVLAKGDGLLGKAGSKFD